ncbi:MAG: 3-oxoacyl-[acyl-carrier-protein] reductase [Pseudomonadota bacterium]|nr:3-oxoacyl-[acyl-carrier-protein] reductase [Pseudomonadota bacterium]
MFDLEGKTALVTGATGGIGSAIAKSLNSHGVSVVLSGRNEDRLKELADNIGDRVSYFSASLDAANSEADLFKNAKKALGRVDILVNNAGVTRDALAIRMSDDDWSRVIEVNLASSFRLARAALKGMMKNRWGRVINITSVVGFTGNPGQTNYVASKAGLSGMSKALAAEVASRGITVNCVAPGFINTPMTDALSEPQRAAIMQRIPAGRLGEPADVAACVTFLASNQACYVTGQTIHVNGGMAMI